MNPDVKSPLTQTEILTHMKNTLEAQGLYVEMARDNTELSISLTGFNLSTVYATVTAKEAEYFGSMLTDDDIHEIRMELAEAIS